jgi:GDPmannose 4,6-dehydratase
VTSGGETGRIALVTGITGQDGSFLAELLLEHGYRVVGAIRGSPADPLDAAEHLRDDLELVRGDLLDPSGLAELVGDLRPDELYHLAAPSFVPDSWERPALTIRAIAAATGTLLEAVRDRSPDTRAFSASSSAMFGDAPESPQREDTPCWPRNPYATAKLAAHNLIGQLREHAGIFACSGILYNHESERRPERFVTRKITRAAAAIKLGLAREVVLGDLDAVRDWSFAGDVVRGAWLTLRQDAPGDYVFASGIGHTVREFAGAAFAHVGLNADEYIRVDPALVRPAESEPLIGDASRARERLGWEPAVGFEQLVQRMVDADLRALDGALSARPGSGPEGRSGSDRAN